MGEPLPQPDPIQEVACAAARLVARQPRNPHRHLDVLRRVELRQQVVKLEDEPDVAVAELDERRVRHRGQLGVGHANLTGIRAIEPAEEVEQRALSHA
jgi:hypothetical protein